MENEDREVKEEILSAKIILVEKTSVEAEVVTGGAAVDQEETETTDTAEVEKTTEEEVEAGGAAVDQDEVEREVTTGSVKTLEEAQDEEAQEKEVQDEVEREVTRGIAKTLKEEAQEEEVETTVEREVETGIALELQDEVEKGGKIEIELLQTIKVDVKGISGLTLEIGTEDKIQIERAVIHKEDHPISLDTHQIEREGPVEEDFVGLVEEDTILQIKEMRAALSREEHRFTDQSSKEILKFKYRDTLPNWLRKIVLLKERELITIRF